MNQASIGRLRQVVQHTVVIELVSSMDGAEAGTRQDRLDALRSMVHATKDAVVKELHSLRRMDPDLEVTGDKTIFPVLQLTATDEVIDRIRRHPLVKSVSPVPTFKLASA